MQLCLETVLEGFSVLVFCPSKAWCENLASAVAKEFYQIGRRYVGNTNKLLDFYQNINITLSLTIISIFRFEKCYYSYYMNIVYIFKKKLDF